jgi:hypothetical protein
MVDFQPEVFGKIEKLVVLRVRRIPGGQVAFMIFKKTDPKRRTLHIRCNRVGNDKQ